MSKEKTKMDINEFANEVRDNIKCFLPKAYENAEVSVMDCQKLNVSYKGLMVKREKEMISPIINLDQFYEIYQNQPETTMEVICRRIAKVVMETPIEVNLNPIMDYNIAKNNLFIRVSSAEKNKDILAVRIRQQTRHGWRNDPRIRRNAHTLALMREDKTDRLHSIMRKTKKIDFNLSDLHAIFEYMLFFTKKVVTERKFFPSQLTGIDRYTKTPRKAQRTADMIAMLMRDQQCRNLLRPASKPRQGLYKTAVAATSIHQQCSCSTFYVNTVPTGTGNDGCKFHAPLPPEFCLPYSTIFFAKGIA